MKNFNSKYMLRKINQEKSQLGLENVDGIPLMSIFKHSNGFNLNTQN